MVKVDCLLILLCFRTICNELLNMLKPDKSSSKKNGPTKVLNAPIHLASMAANLENDMNDIKSIWVMHRDDTLVNRM